MTVPGRTMGSHCITRRKRAVRCWERGEILLSAWDYVKRDRTPITCSYDVCRFYSRKFSEKIGNGSFSLLMHQNFLFGLLLRFVRSTWTARNERRCNRNVGDLVALSVLETSLLGLASEMPMLASCAIQKIRDVSFLKPVDHFLKLGAYA